MQMSDGTAVLVVILSIGVGYLTADLTPGLAGPGWIAFALTAIGSSITWGWWQRRQQRQRSKPRAY